MKDSSLKIACMVAGYKGFLFAKALLETTPLRMIVSYKVAGTLDSSYENLIELSRDYNTSFRERDRFSPKDLMEMDLILVVGWQYLIPETDNRFVVFHDSLLPAYRGFAPTVTALIKGLNRLGVSAIIPSHGADRGMICGQRPLRVQYPVKIKNVYQELVAEYVYLARDLIVRFCETGQLPPGEVQREEEATYSLWLDSHDYFIDWSWSAEKIARFVDAVGWPYLGARTYYRQEIIQIVNAEPIADYRFENRTAGKFWHVDKHSVDVVCGEGLLRVHTALSPNGDTLVFHKLRERFWTHGFAGLMPQLELTPQNIEPNPARLSQ